MNKLSDLGINGNVRIGAKDGSAFFYCGRIEDLSINEVDIFLLK